MSSPSREAALRVMRALGDAGHTAYLAGGCVRDALLGLEPKDHDVATDTPPEAVLQLWPKSQPVGQAFGVVLCYAKIAGKRIAIEVATFRTEGPYSDGRRPDSVDYTDAQHDAQRRDFTVNGLFADPFDQPQPPGADTATCPTTGDRVIDFVHGLPDLLESKVIRAIGEPDRRFAEDYLRMLRAVRFASRMGFALHPATAEAIRTHAPKLDRISRERIGEEVKRTLLGPAPALAARLWDALQLTAAIFGEAVEPLDSQTLEALPPEADLGARLAAWIDARKPSIDAPRARAALDLSNQQRDDLSQTLGLRESLRRWPELGAAARKRLAAHPRFAQTLMWALAGALPGTLASAIDEQAAALALDGVGLAPEPFVTGDDLLQLGLTAGPDFKRWLDRAYDDQLEGRTTSRKQALDRLRQMTQPEA
ncbi:MAG: CCA tRNA nucleotidyltransferase [Planctomycetota bacterium]